jgi:hypothetical protein
MNRQPPYQVIQPVRPYQYVSQVHTIHPVRLIATPPMTPFEYDSRSVVDNFSEASYENYRNNHVFNQMRGSDYSTFGLGPGLRTIPDNGPPTPPDSPVIKPKSRRQSKYVEAVVNGPPAPPQKKEDDVVIITLPGPAQAPVPAQAQAQASKEQVKAPVVAQVKEQVKEPVKILKKETNEPPKETFKHVAIDGDFKPAPPMKLTGEQFKILDDSARKYYSEDKETKPVEEPAIKKYVPPMQKNKTEECNNTGAKTSTIENTVGSVSKTNTSTNTKTCANANTIESVVGPCIDTCADPGSTPFISKLLHTPNFYGFAKDDTEPIIYNTVNEKRTKKYKFITMEQVVCIEGKLYYIPGQVVAMDAAEYQHTLDCTKA